MEVAEKKPKFVMSLFLHLAKKFSKLSPGSTCRGGVQLNCHKASTEVAMSNR